MQYIVYMKASLSGKIERIPLRERAYHLLQQAIVTGELQPGQRVRDVDIATQLGVSRTPVREALQRLGDEGLVQTLPGAQTRIVPLGTQAAREAFPVVAVLHALATRLAVEHLSQQDFATLQQANDRFALALEAPDFMAAIEADDAFHGLFVSIARNTEIQRALERLMPKVRRLEMAQFASLAGRSSVQQHQAILSACEQRQPGRAAELSEQNWLSLGQLIVQSLDEQEPPVLKRNVRNASNDRST
jgi:DNA-binding GntR family transcriptional regulator